MIKGKIVICTLEQIRDDRLAKAVAIQDGGGVGIILVDPLAKDVGIQFVLPGTLIGLEEAKELFTYVEAEKYVGTSRKIYKKRSNITTNCCGRKIH